MLDSSGAPWTGTCWHLCCAQRQLEVHSREPDELLALCPGCVCECGLTHWLTRTAFSELVLTFDCRIYHFLKFFFFNGGALTEKEKTI